MKGSVAPPGCPRMHQEGKWHTTGDSRDGGRRPEINLVSTSFSKWGCGHLLGPLVSAWEVVPPGSRWIQQGGGVNHYNSTMRRQREQNWVHRTWHREVGITQRSERHTTAVSNHLIRGLLNCRSISSTPMERHCTRAGREQAGKGTHRRPDSPLLSLPARRRAQGGDQLPIASIALVKASKSETWIFVLCLRTYSMKGVSICRTRGETGTQVSWEG